MTNIVQERMAAKQEAAKREVQVGSNAARVKKPPVQQSLSKMIHVSDNILSLHMWIQKIVIKNMPIYDIECEVEREMVRYGKVKSVKTVLDTAHNLVEIVEQKIANMMKLAPAGQIIFDGYTVAGQHYVAVFASFMRNCTSIAEGNELKYDKHELRLLACAPLPPIDGDIGNENEESTEFNSDAHVNYFRKTMELYGIDYDTWVLCQCADSASVNIKIAKETHCRHISCKNHNLALAGKAMLEENSELKDLMAKVFACGAHVRNSCKVSTGLRNKAAAVDQRLTNVSAKSESATRQWLGAAICMKQHIKIQPFLHDLVKDKVGKMKDHQECVEISFMDKLQDHYSYMRIIRGCSEALQKPGRTLGECQMMLNHLIGKVHGQNGNVFDKCDLKLRYLHANNGLSTDWDFETGIAKIQCGSERTMTPAEKRACKDFQIDSITDSDDESEDMVGNGGGDYFLEEFERAKRQKTKDAFGQSDYINCKFVTGSAAVVESLWSMYDAFNTKRRRGMSPITVEMILYLKKNKDLWGVNDIAKANQNRLKTGRSERLQKKIAEHEEYMRDCHS